MLLIISVTVKILEGYKLRHQLCLIWLLDQSGRWCSHWVAVLYQRCYHIAWTGRAELREQHLFYTCDYSVLNVKAMADHCSETSNIRENIIIDIQKCIATVPSDCLYAYALFLPSLATPIQAQLSGITSDHKADKPCWQMSHCFMVTYCVSPLLLGGTDQMSCNLWKIVLFLIHSSST